MNTDRFLQAAKDYAALCIQVTALKASLPECEFYAQYRADVADNVPYNEREEPCEMQGYPSGPDHADWTPLPLEEHCPACQKRAAIVPQIKATNNQRRGAKLRMLSAYKDIAAEVQP